MFFGTLTPSEACGPDATCINRPSGLGYDCRCHLGKFGNKCMEGKARCNCYLHKYLYFNALSLFITKCSVNTSIFHPTWSFKPGELVTTPLFNGEESYIAYPPLTNVHDDLRVELDFKPLERNGLMFFCGGKKMKVEDFVTISMVEGHVEFRYELGTGNVYFV